MTFLSEEESFDFIYKFKWPQGYCCPRCSHSENYKIATRRVPLYECRACSHQTSLTAGTVMERSRLPLSKWVAILQLVSQPDSISAVRLSKTVRITYKTAWKALNRIRQAISDLDSTRLLSGTVRVRPHFYSDAYINPFAINPHKHPILLGASYDECGKPLQVKMKLVNRKHLQDRDTITREAGYEFAERHINSAIDPSSLWKGHNLYQAKSLAPLLRSCWHWIGYTFRGIGLQYLQSYIDEFCFRLDRSRGDQSVLERLAEVCMSDPALRAA